ncbi:MAG: 16S rRNA (cytosine(1402)-N(4))-methyltransferase RsmH [Candidatus Latescibacterota bacterium]
MPFHVTVMVAQVVAGLVWDRRGRYLDATAGGGGHSRAILEALDLEGRLLAADRDPEAVAATRGALAEYGERATVVQATFVQLRQVVQEHDFGPLAGVLFDLGVSSHQIDAAERGFSYREEGPLDMRMDPAAGLPVAAWLAQAEPEELEQVIRRYGEERQARRIARSICRIRQDEALRTTADLRRAVERARPAHLTKTLARVFQALRMAANEEPEQLDAGLDAAADLLGPGGRLVTVAYHSLEDRRVKVRLGPQVKGCICPPRVPVCVCGRRPTFRKVLPRPQRAATDEVARNRRARSAVLRVYERV